MEVVMKLLKRIILVMAIAGVLSLTGCDKVKFGIYNASEDNAGTVRITDISDKKNEDESEKGKDKGSSDKDNKSNKGNKDNKDNKDSDNADANDKASTSTDTIGQAGSSSPTPIQPNPTIDLQVYTVNDATAEIEPVTALIPQDSKITAELIVDTVVESLADQSIFIEIDSITTENDKVIVSFVKDKAPYSDMGSGYEAAILDAIAQSLIDNLKEYKKVIYRIENKPYVSGVFEYGIDEAHLIEN